FTEHDLIIPLGHDAFGGQQPLVDRRGNAAFEQNRQLRFSDAPQKREVLHVARADLNHVGILLYEIDAGRIERFRDDLQAERFARIREDLEAFLAQACKIIRRTARLECSTSEEPRAARLNRLRHREGLLTALARTWTRKRR